MSSSMRRKSKGVKLESKKTLELTQFVDSHDIDPIYFEKPYYVVPADDLAEEAFIVLREALKRGRIRSGSANLRHARPRICRQHQGLRSWHGDGDAALR